MNKIIIGRVIPLALLGCAVASLSIVSLNRYRVHKVYRNASSSGGAIVESSFAGGVLTDILELDFRNSSLDDGAFRTIAAEAEGFGVELLDLANTSLSDDTMPLLHKFPQLRWIDISGTSVTSKGLADIVNLPHLETVVAYDTDIDERFLSRLSPRVEIRRVQLHGDWRLTPEVPPWSLERRANEEPVRQGIETIRPV